jgi:hypothetical protein
MSDPDIDTPSQNKPRTWRKADAAPGPFHTALHFRPGHTSIEDADHICIASVHRQTPATDRLLAASWELREALEQIRHLKTWTELGAWQVGDDAQRIAAAALDKLKEEPCKPS